MFSVISVCPQGGRGSKVTITHNVLHLTVQGPPRPWKCSYLFRLDFTVHGPPRCWRLVVLKHVQLASGRYASYWNAFLFSKQLTEACFRVYFIGLPLGLGFFLHFRPPPPPRLEFFQCSFSPHWTVLQATGTVGLPSSCPSFSSDLWLQ